MIEVKNLSYAFPGKDLYNDISFTIEDGQHCVLIGSSGTGKTTLLDLLIHTEKYLFDGSIKKSGNIRVGYVNQFIKHEKDREITVFDYLCEDFNRMQSEMDRLCREMEHAEDIEAVMERYQKSMDEFDAVDGYNHEINIHKQLKLAGLQQLEKVPVSKVSGGEYKLIQVIRQMLLAPGILMMDEPDVFLDFENLNGLRDLINAHRGTILIITHNRYLLNHCFDKVLHLENEELREFDGSYGEYTFALLQMKVQMQEAAEKETEWIEFQQEVVERLRERATRIDSTTNGRSLRARVSYLDRLVANRTERPFLETLQPEIHLPHVYAEGEDGGLEEPSFALKVEDYEAVFDEPLLEHVSFEIGPHDKVALVGANGTGKTTILWEIWQRCNPTITIHPDIEVAFLSQLYGEMFCENQTIYESFEQLGFRTEREIQAYLADYCFREESLGQKIRCLSGGEKNLLQLAQISVSSAGLLLLDEPTSHLDLHAQLALEKALANYRGAVLMVSHDFYSIANCVDYVLYVENHTIQKKSSRAFRKLVYKNHFSKDYLELEQKKKELELKITAVLKTSDYRTARELCDQLEDVIRKMQ